MVQEKGAKFVKVIKRSLIPCVETLTCAQLHVYPRFLRLLVADGWRVSSLLLLHLVPTLSPSYHETLCVTYAIAQIDQRRPDSD